MADLDAPSEQVGYRKPPASTRFQKGSSGNPKGRPRGRTSELPYEAVLGQKVAVREDGRERRVTAAEAFLLYLSKRGLEGDGSATRSALSAIEKARGHWDPHGADGEKLTVVFRSVGVGSVATAARSLKIARKLDPYRPTARLMLEPWVVEAALARLGDRRLTPDEQETVVRATRTPHRVRWPEWWAVDV